MAIIASKELRLCRDILTETLVSHRLLVDSLSYSPTKFYELGSERSYTPPRQESGAQPSDPSLSLTSRPRPRRGERGIVYPQLPSVAQAAIDRCNQYCLHLTVPFAGREST